MVAIHRGENPSERAARDNSQAQSQTAMDLIEYLAMMTDVEIPSDESEGQHEPEI